MDKPNIEDLLPKQIDTEPSVPLGMSKFTVYRRGDESGVSGTGMVIQGVLFADGKCVVQWLRNPDPGDVQVKTSFVKFLDVHVKSHPTNKTIITWEDGTQDFYPEEEE
jgi:hypothetical protein